MKDVRLEIIAVDDGSTDKSRDIIQSYSERYPNIYLHHQSHGRQGKARNTGMEKASGEYFVFLDADDVLGDNALKLFLSQARRDQCDFLVGVAESFNDKVSWINEGYQSYTHHITNTDIDRFPDLLLDPSACNKMYSAIFLKNNRIVFPENTYCEDVGFIYTAYFLAHKISIIPEILHRYRARGKSGELSGTQTFSEERIAQCADIYAVCLDQYQSVENRAILELLEARAMIRFQRFFNRMAVYPDSRSYMYETLENLFLKISPEVIAQNGGQFAVPFFMMRHGHFVHAVAVLKSPGNTTALCDFFHLLAEHDPEQSFSFFKYFIVYKSKPVFAQPRPSVKDLLNSVKRFLKKSLSLRNEMPKSKKQWQSKFNAIRNNLWGVLLRIWCSFAKWSPPRIWMIGERNGTSAEENGYAFFKYCQSQPDAGKVYYVIEKPFLISQNLSNERNIIIKGSWRHLYLLGFTKFIIFNNDIWDIYPKIHPSWLPDPQKIFLTHGIKLYGPGVYMRNHANAFDAILVSSEKEKQVLKYEWNVWDPAKLMVMGLPRFDNLLDAIPKKEILFCPTWRKSIGKMDHAQFMETDFFRSIADLLEDERLTVFLNFWDFTLVLRTHFNLEKYISCFQGWLNDRIRIEDSASPRNLQQAMKASMVLITDYSSIFWDMAYMHRPVILYQFDREAFLAERGLHAFGLEEKEMGFAKIARTPDEVLDHLKSIANNNFALAPAEIQSADGFFAYRDIQNCKRLYDFLNKLPDPGVGLRSKKRGFH